MGKLACRRPDKDEGTRLVQGMEQLGRALHTGPVKDTDGRFLDELWEAFNIFGARRDQLKGMSGNAFVQQQYVTHRYAQALDQEHGRCESTVFPTLSQASSFRRFPKYSSTCQYSSCKPQNSQEPFRQLCVLSVGGREVQDGLSEI